MCISARRAAAPAPESPVNTPHLTRPRSPPPSLPRVHTAASRVKSIKNDVTRDVATREVARLRALVAHWRAKAGEAGPEELEDVADVGERPAA